jgi:hypothetical protein
VGILPSTGTRTGCIRAVPDVPRPELALQNGSLQANTYDVPNGTTGAAGMCYNAVDGSMFAYANWSRVGAPGGWFSYPQVAYGVDLYDGVHTTYTNQSPAWELPQTVAQTVNESLWVVSRYEFNAPPPGDVDGYDLSFDDFLSEGLPPTFEVTPFVEVEIFLAHNISYPYHWIHWQMPTLVNGSVTLSPWDIAYWCHGVDNGSNANISFDLSFDGQGTHGLNGGTIGVNLSAVFAEVESILPSASCWTGPADRFSSFYLGEEDLGSEDGANGGTAFNYNWTISAYCLQLHVARSGPPSIGCTSSSEGSPALRPSGENAGAPTLAVASAVTARPR